MLPLDNMMGDAEQDYFVEGMHDALIAELSKISALKVISRTSTIQYQGTKKPVPVIARELGRRMAGDKRGILKIQLRGFLVGWQRR